MKIALSQINTKPGDIRGNLSKVKLFYEKARHLQADIAVFPEMTLPGYPPLDMVTNPAFVRANLDALARAVSFVGETACVVGYAEPNPFSKGKPLFNSLALIHNRKIIAKRRKSLLPTYDVFDELRYFEPYWQNLPVRFKGRKIGLTICEDIWAGTEMLERRLLYKNNPIREFKKHGLDLLINISSSPFYAGKHKTRIKILAEMSKELRAPVIYCNQVGGNGELIFDGNSVCFDSKGSLIAKARSFAEDMVIADVSSPPASMRSPKTPLIEEIHEALALGIKDYFTKQGFSEAVIGISGGIDSSVVFCLACKALGSGNVSGVLMPSAYTLKQSVKDAFELCERAGVKPLIIPIHEIYGKYLDKLFKPVESRRIDLTMQNIQARIRGSILMAMANKNNRLVLATGNKSEIATGYCTLYGDTAGALAPIGDLVKTSVYELADFINKKNRLIPLSIIKRVPTAELKPGQKDQDDLPPYRVLDKIIRLYVEEGKTLSQIIKTGLDKKLVFEVIKRMESNEYKRKQLPPSLKVTKKAFGSGRRMPIVKSFEFYY